MTVAPSQAPQSTGESDRAKKPAQDGRSKDNYLAVPVEILFDQVLTEGAIALWILLSSMGLRLGQGVHLDELMTKLPCRRRSLFVYMKALQDRGLLGWAVIGGKYFFTLMPLEWVYGPLSESWAPAHHAVIADGDIPFRAKLLLFTLDKYKQPEGLWVGEKKLDEKLHWGDKTIRKHLRWLEEDGLQTVLEPRQRRRRNGKWTSLHRELTAATERYTWPRKDQVRPGASQDSSAGMTPRRHPASAGMTPRLEAPSAGMTALETPDPKNSKEPQPPGGGAKSQEQGSVSGQAGPGRRIRLVRVGQMNEVGDGTARLNSDAPKAQQPAPASVPSPGSSPTPSPTQGSRAPQARRGSKSAKRTAPRSTPEQLQAKPIPDWDADDLADRYAHGQDLPRSRMSERNPRPGDYAGAKIDYEKLSAGIQQLLDAGNQPYDIRLNIDHFHQHYGGGLLNCPWALFLFRARNQIQVFRQKDPSNRNRGETDGLGRSPSNGRSSQRGEERRIEWEQERTARAEARAREEAERKAQEQARLAAERAALLPVHREKTERCQVLEAKWMSSRRTGIRLTDEEDAEYKELLDWLIAHPDLEPAGIVAAPAA